MNRKLKKLIKTPRLYFVDMFKKKMAKGMLSVKFLPMLKVKGNQKYSVVSAVYGVEKYLEKYFSSIENQTLDFQKHIELIMVDDGSLDGSATIIKKWVKKYPENIKYVKKENGGQASARNYGMEFVSHDWVTFIDPDDFIGMNYFAEVDKTISERVNIGLVSCNFIFYFEDKDIFSDTHPLNYRFNNDSTILDANNLGKYIQLSVNSAFFKTRIILDNRLEMSPLIKPSFEDGHFAGKYLLCLKGSEVGFIKGAKYYYRKRQDNTSTLDSGWRNPLQYSDKLKFGNLDLLQYAKEMNGEVPEFIQRTVLYDLIWYLKYIVNNKNAVSFLDAEEKNNFLILFKKIFEYLDAEVINSFELAGCWFFHKIGMMGAFKGESFPFQFVYIEEFNPIKQLVRLRYFFHGQLPLEVFKIGDEELIPSYAKTCIHDFIGETFIHERIVWLHIDNTPLDLSVSLGEIIPSITMTGKRYTDDIPVRDIIKNFTYKKFNGEKPPPEVLSIRNKAKSPATTKLYDSAWLFMDRDTQADDNAEHLYRYVKKNHKDVNAFFILRKSSHDWHRLSEEGFSLLDFDSNEHKMALLNASHLISSHADKYVTDLLPREWYGDLLNFQFTFLQHGVTQNDLSSWFNTKPMELLITATQKEYNSIANDDNLYKFSPKEVALTGFPRHDALLELSKEVDQENTILIMPTWRKGLIGASIGNSNLRELNPAFYESDFANGWKSLLHSSNIKELAVKKNCNILFFPHANLEPYLSWFDAPDYIKIISHSDIDSMQKLFCKAAVMITDYSSVAFEMAYLGKTVIYFHVDHDFAFGGGHIFNQGYFSYKDDGFGPVAYDQEKLLNDLGEIVKNDLKPSKTYLNRMQSAFYKRDGRSRERVYAAIKRLESSELVDNQAANLRVEYARKAFAEKHWLIAAERWRNIYQNKELFEDRKKEVGLSLVRSYRLAENLIQAEKWLNDLSENWGKSNDLVKKKDLHLECVKLLNAYYLQEMSYKNWCEAKQLMSKGDWNNSLQFWNRVYLDPSSELYIELQLYKIECLAYLKQYNKIQKEINLIKNKNISGSDRLILEGWDCVAKNDFDAAIKAWESIDIEQSFHKCLALSFINYQVGNFTRAMHYSEKSQGMVFVPIFDEKNNLIPKINEIEKGLDLDSADITEDEMNLFIESLKYYDYNAEVKKFIKLQNNK